jgi:hypothetical protein
MGLGFQGFSPETQKPSTYLTHLHAPHRSRRCRWARATLKFYTTSIPHLHTPPYPIHTPSIPHPHPISYTTSCAPCRSRRCRWARARAQSPSSGSRRRWPRGSGWCCRTATWPSPSCQSGYRPDTLNSDFRHFERVAEGRRDQIRVSHFERDLGELGDLVAQNSNGRAVRTCFWDWLQQGELDCCVVGWSWWHGGAAELQPGQVLPAKVCDGRRRGGQGGSGRAGMGRGGVWAWARLPHPRSPRHANPTGWR